jgi:hypothetical protein
MRRPHETVILDESIMGETNFAMPEHVLWLAVIERAMMDYIGRTASLSKPSFVALDNFFFDEQPRQHNLVYICENLFDFPDAVPMIRRRVKELAEMYRDKAPDARTNNYYVISNSKRRVDRG